LLMTVPIDIGPLCNSWRMNFKLVAILFVYKYIYNLESDKYVVSIFFQRWDTIASHVKS
jgi:hypothetical protein